VVIPPLPRSREGNESPERKSEIRGQKSDKKIH